MEQSAKRQAPSPNQETKDDSQETGTFPRETPLVEMMAEGPDLTEEGRLEAQLMQSANMLFLRTIALDIAAHELRNSLAIILGTTEFMLGHPGDNELHIECADRVQIAAEHALMILENSLQSVRSLYSDMTEVDLIAILEKGVYLLTPQLVLQNVNLQKEFQSNLPRISGNPVALQQVFINLITNALKAMPRGGTLTVVSRALETQYVEIRFHDTGRGIPQKYLPRIFDPFFTREPAGKGMGLGLSISHSIMQQHKGTIEAESEVGKGSTFTLRLPCQTSI